MQQRSRLTKPAHDQEAKSCIASLATHCPPPIIRSLGRSVMDPVWREKAHRGRFSELMYVVHGRVNFIMVETDLRIHGREGDTIYTPRGALHRDDFPPDVPFEVYLVQFTWAGEQELLDRFSPSQLTPSSEASKLRFGSEFHELYQEFKRSGLDAPELANLRLLQIILSLVREAELRKTKSEPATVRRQSEIMARARQVIRERYHEPLSLDDIAAAVHVSPYHLSHVFSAESGFTLFQYLTRIRMERAADDLRHTRHPIQQIAYAVGYRDPRNFGRAFRRHFGVSASQFRRQQR